MGRKEEEALFGKPIVGHLPSYDEMRREAGVFIDYFLELEDLPKYTPPPERQ